MKTTFIKFSHGMWYIHESNNEYHVYYQATTSLPQLMLICKGREVFDALAECCSLMYGQLHPEISWDDKLAKEIEGLL